VVKFEDLEMEQQRVDALGRKLVLSFVDITPRLLPGLAETTRGSPHVRVALTHGDTTIGSRGNITGRLSVGHRVRFRSYANSSYYIVKINATSFPLSLVLDREFTEESGLQPWFTTGFDRGDEVQQILIRSLDGKPVYYGRFTLTLHHRNTSQQTVPISVLDRAEIVEAKLSALSNIDAVKVFRLPVNSPSSHASLLKRWIVAFPDCGAMPLLHIHVDPLHPVRSRFGALGRVEVRRVHVGEEVLESDAFVPNLPHAFRPSLLRDPSTSSLVRVGRALKNQPQLEIVDALGTRFTTYRGNVTASLVPSNKLQTLRCWASGGHFTLSVDVNGKRYTSRPISWASAAQSDGWHRENHASVLIPNGT
jgi:hypothetical protein